MRYYDIHITDRKTGDTVRHWSSLTSEYSNDPAALKVTFDMLTVAGQAASGNSILNIYGVPLHDLQEPNDLFRQQVTVRGGMTAGLPLAKPEQAGILFKGQVWESFANWMGTDMSLSLTLAPTPHGVNEPGNYILHWHKGQPLADALRTCFNTALPGLPQQIDISPLIVSQATQAMVAPTLDVLAQQVYDYTAAYFEGVAPGFEGVQIGIRRGEIRAWDSTQPQGYKQVSFEDLIGQPNWFGVERLEFVTPLRADISIGDVVKMPRDMENLPGFVQTQAAAYPSQNRYKTTFTGHFIVQQVRHIGDSRSPSGKEWASVFICTPYKGPVA